MSDAGSPPGATPTPPPPVSPDARVCVRCGRPATDKDFCVCGANLDAMRAMLPTRAEWEQANPEKAALPPPEPPPPGEEPPPPRTRPIKWEGKGLPIPLSDRMRKQILPSVLVIAVFAAIVIFGSSNSSKKGGIQTSTLPAASTPTTSTAAKTSTTAGTSTTHSAPATAGPTLAACATAWNGGRSATHRHILNLAVLRDPSPAALIATWRGAEQRLARFGGGSQVLVTSNACIVAAHDSVFIQQPNGNWGLVKATPGSPFALKPGGPGWGEAHHNATVKVGPLRGGPADVGAVTPTGQKLPVLR